VDRLHGSLAIKVVAVNAAGDGLERGSGGSCRPRSSGAYSGAGDGGTEPPRSPLSPSPPRGLGLPSHILGGLMDDAGFSEGGFSVFPPRSAGGRRTAIAGGSPRGAGHAAAASSLLDGSLVMDLLSGAGGSAGAAAAAAALIPRSMARAMSGGGGGAGHGGGGGGHASTGMAASGGGGGGGRGDGHGNADGSAVPERNGHA